MILLWELLLVLAVTPFFWALARRPSPGHVFATALRRMLAEKEYRRPLAFALAILVLNGIESSLDSRVTAALGYDATPFIHGLEGDLAVAFQKATSLPCTYLFTLVYIVFFPVIMAAPLFLAAAEGDLAAFRALNWGIILNYAICLPFYFLFPVKEMWAGNPEKVRLLVDQVSPAIMEAYRTTSALDNCFPSFHTSMSLTIAVIVSGRQPKLFALAIGATALAIVFSTLYLGIHWLSDVAAGALLAFFAAWMAQRKLQ